MSRILVVEDEPALLRGLADNLKRELHEVLTAADGEAGYQLIKQKKPDLVVLDLMLPKLSGYEVCRQVRAEGIATPILILTARGEETDRVVGLDLGADDYVTKPFSVREFLARVRALLRRGQPKSPNLDELTVDDVVIDFRKSRSSENRDRHCHANRDDPERVPDAARTGVASGRSRDSRRAAQSSVGGRCLPTTRTVDNHIAALRAKLERDSAQPRHLLTVRGVGYKWVP